MILNVDGQELEFFEWDHSAHSTFMLGLSGGTDSAMFLYLACMAIPEKKIICHTGVDTNNRKDPWIAHYASDIIDWMRKQFPKVDIMHEPYHFNSGALENITQARKEIEEAEDKSIFPTVYGHAKAVAQRPDQNRLRRKYNVTLSGHGITKNPPIELPRAESRRNREYDRFDVWPSGKIHYKPFVNVDKKYIAGLYKQYNLMDTLFPMTYSCVGNSIVTKYHSEPCKECFWCHEKKWAFGCYDGGRS